jgi:GDP-mannose 6-dehydrogenase
MNVTVFGLGYVGCVTAACLARNGHQVVGVDINPDKVGMVNSGTSPIIEPGLAELLSQVVREGRLRATDSVEDALRDASVALICVGTPGVGHGQQDLSGLARVASDIGKAHAADPHRLTLVLRSTVLPGTAERVLGQMLSASSASPDVRIRTAVNPEFMREGSSLADFDRPPFVLVGCDDDEVEVELRELYSTVNAPFVRTTVRTAEMVKYVCNTFHALKVTFANEVADVCDTLGADAQEVMRIFRMDRKLNISEAYLTPGFAFGGSCLPKDVRALLHASRIHDLTVPLLAAIMPANENQIHRAVDTILATRKRRIGVVGLAFKPNTDDLRESPMVTLVETLIGKGCHVRILDPNVAMARLTGANRRYIETEIPHIASLLCTDAESLVNHAEVLVIGSAGPDAERVLAAADEERTIVDLTRGTVRTPVRAALTERDERSEGEVSPDPVLADLLLRVSAGARATGGYR